MLDYLAIGVHELSSMSERRIERLVNPGNMSKEPFFFSFFVFVGGGFLIFSGPIDIHELTERPFVHVVKVSTHECGQYFS